MSDGQFWLAIFLSLLGLNAALIAFKGEGRRGMRWLAVPLVASAAATAYVLLFDRDPQDPIFLVMFYVTAAVSCALGSVIGQAIHKRLR